MDQPPLDNRTQFKAHPQLLVGKSAERLAVVVKATYELDPKSGALVLAPDKRRRGIRMSDVLWGEPEVSSIKYPSDLYLTKRGTDVVVVATAYAPRDEATGQFDVFVKVGALQKALRVYGLRVWEAGGAGISQPRPVKQVDVSYENAWGGTDKSDPTRVAVEPRNPVGKGVARDPGALTHQIAPCIEDPQSPIRSYRTAPPPGGLGAIARHWEPRRRFAGTYDNAWKQTRAPITPKDEDDQINNFASPGLTSPTPLLGVEQVGLLNLVPGGVATQFSLPDVGLEVEFRVKNRPVEILRPSLDTILIDSYLMKAGLPLCVELVWRASTKAPRRMLDSKTIVRKISVA
jgi:hypothetical protein